MLVASAVPTKKHSNDSASAGVKPLPEAAPANLSQDDNQASQNGEHNSNVGIGICQAVCDLA